MCNGPRASRAYLAAMAAILSSTIAGQVWAGSFDRPQVAGERLEPAVVPGPRNTGPGTSLVALPTDLCRYDGGLPANVASAIQDRSDYPELLGYMAENCPEDALALSDTATASVASSTATGGADDPAAGREGINLCSYRNGMPVRLQRRLERRADYDELLAQVFEVCPEVGLVLGDRATGSTGGSGGREDDNEDDGTSNIVPVSGGGSGGSGGDGGGSGGSGGDGGGSGGSGGNGGGSGGSGGDGGGSGGSGGNGGGSGGSGGNGGGSGGSGGNGGGSGGSGGNGGGKPGGGHGGGKPGGGYGGGDKPGGGGGKKDCPTDNEPGEVEDNEG
ncbi:MAG: hypothetical protein AAFR35_04935 [Pseudomonadota bacterium]